MNEVSLFKDHYDFASARHIACARRKHLGEVESVQHKIQARFSEKREEPKALTSRRIQLLPASSFSRIVYFLRSLFGMTKDTERLLPVFDQVVQSTQKQFSLEWEKRLGGRSQDDKEALKPREQDRFLRSIKGALFLAHLEEEIFRGKEISLLAKSIGKDKKLYLALLSENSEEELEKLGAEEGLLNMVKAIGPLMPEQLELLKLNYQSQGKDDYFLTALNHPPTERFKVIAKAFREFWEKHETGFNQVIQFFVNTRFGVDGQESEPLPKEIITAATAKLKGFLRSFVEGKYRELCNHYKKLGYRGTFRRRALEDISFKKQSELLDECTKEIVKIVDEVKPLGYKKGFYETAIEDGLYRVFDKDFLLKIFQQAIPKTWSSQVEAGRDLLDHQIESAKNSVVRRMNTYICYSVGDFLYQYFREGGVEGITDENLKDSLKSYVSLIRDEILAFWLLSYPDLEGFEEELKAPFLQLEDEIDAANLGKLQELGDRYLEKLIQTEVKPLLDKNLKIYPIGDFVIDEGEPQLTDRARIVLDQTNEDLKRKNARKAAEKYALDYFFSKV